MTQQMTKAEIVEETKQRILAQGGYAVDENGGCSYLTKSGTKCAVGVWLDDPDLLGCGLAAESLDEEYIADLPICDISFWSRLQDIHDRCADSLKPLTDFAARMDALKAEVSS